MAAVDLEDGLRDTSDYCKEMSSTVAGHRRARPSTGVRTDPSVRTLAAVVARRLRRPHCSIMDMSGTDMSRSVPGKGQTRVRSLARRRRGLSTP